MTVSYMRGRLLLLILLLTPLLPPAAFGDGFIVVPPPDLPVSLPGGAFPLEVKYHHVTVDIKDRTAVTSIDQAFFNPHSRTLEGEYIFPVPAGAVITHFSMFIDGREMNAELLDAVKAKKIYEDIVRRTRDPALLEYQGANLFRMRIFPLEPHKEKRIKISYREILSQDGSLIEYVYPLNTEKFSSALIDSVSIRVAVESREKIKSVFSTTHGIDTSYHGDRKAVVGWEAARVKPDVDFKLYYSSASSDFGAALLTHRASGEDGFFHLDLAPGFREAGHGKVAKDIVFVLDVSGSMAGDKLAKAKAALQRCLSRLAPSDRFSIVRFSTEAEALFNTPVPADGAHLSQAAEYVERLKALGGTNIEQALTTALSLCTKAAGGDRRLPLIVFITDGKPTIGETNSDALVTGIVRNNTVGARIFTIGIDFALDTVLLDKITTATRASRIYISPREDIETAVTAFFQKVDAPVLTDIRISVKGDVILYAAEPAFERLPDLFLGSSLTILGRYRGAGAAVITVKGVTGDRTVELSYPLEFPKEKQGDANIAPLWAARRIGFLLESIRLRGEEKELIEEVTFLARTYGIITPYTSYLIIEDEARRVSRNELAERDQTLRNAAPQAAFREKSKKDFERLNEQSGESGVASSADVQALRQARSNEPANASRQKLAFTDEGGRLIDVPGRIKQAGGRAFYHSGREWIDTAIQNQKAKKTNRIRFASADYWSLLAKKPETAVYLALGANVRFMHGSEEYEIYE